MKKILFAALALPLLLASCGGNEYDGSDSNYKTPVRFAFFDQADISTSLTKEKYDLTVLKSGETAGAVNVVADETLLEAYNLEHGTAYVAVPSNLYTIGQSSIDFSADETSKIAQITWNGGGINALDESLEYAIAVRLSSDDAAAVSTVRDFVILRPAATTLAIEQTEIKTHPAASREVANVSAVVSMNNPEETDITVNYTIDNDLIAAYNEANGTSYVAAPASLAALASGSAVVKAGALSTQLSLSLSSAQLFNGNELKAVDNNKYLVPIRITSLSSDAIRIANDVVYVAVDLNGDVRGPWTLLEGMEFCLAEDPLPEPYNTASYKASNLFDGIVGPTDAGVWASWWNTMNVFPITFVADMGQARVFTKFRIADTNGYQGSVRNYEIYTAETYNGASTQWNLVAKGLRDYSWVVGGATYDYPVQKMIAGRYIKFVILNHERPQSAWTGDYVNGRCKISEVFGTGF